MIYDMKNILFTLLFAFVGLSLAAKNDQTPNELLFQELRDNNISFIASEKDSGYVIIDVINAKTSDVCKLVVKHNVNIGIVRSLSDLTQSRSNCSAQQ